MDSFGNMLAILGFTIAVICFVELKKTEEILSRYVNEEDKALLLSKENPHKTRYAIIMICLLVFVVLIGYFSHAYMH